MEAKNLAVLTIDEFIRIAFEEDKRWDVETHYSLSCLDIVCRNAVFEVDEDTLYILSTKEEPCAFISIVNYHDAILEIIVDDIWAPVKVIKMILDDGHELLMIGIPHHKKGAEE